MAYVYRMLRLANGVAPDFLRSIDMAECPVMRVS